MGVSEDFESVFKEMLDSNICVNHSSLYVWSAYFFESKGKFHDAHKVYELGILRLVLGLFLSIAGIAFFFCIRSFVIT